MTAAPLPPVPALAAEIRALRAERDALAARVATLRAALLYLDVEDAALARDTARSALAADDAAFAAARLRAEVAERDEIGRQVVEHFMSAPLVEDDAAALRAERAALAAVAEAAAAFIAADDAIEAADAWTAEMLAAGRDAVTALRDALAARTPDAARDGAA